MMWQGLFHDPLSKFVVCMPSQVVPLIENGGEIEVTEENKLKYLHLLAQHRLVKSVKEETEAFLKGKCTYNNT